MRSLLAVPVTCKSPFLGNIYLSEKIERRAVHGWTIKRRWSVSRCRPAIAIDNAHLHAQAAEIATALERLRIAHEMHDGLAQVLGYVNTKVQAADAIPAPRQDRRSERATARTGGSARQAYSDVREAIVGLRTLAGQRSRALAEVLPEFLDQWKEQSGVEHAPDDRRGPAPEDLGRAAGGAHHSGSRSPTSASTHTPPWPRVECPARGRTARRHHQRRRPRLHAGSSERGEFPRFGLTTMRERAKSIGGTLDIKSAPGKGTTVRFTMPLSCGHGFAVTAMSSQ